VSSKFLWQNFSSRPEKVGEGVLEALQDEARREKQASGSSSKEGEHTSLEIQRAKEKASQSTGKAKKCSAGKPCSATCIHKNDDCISTLPAPLGIALTRLSKVLSEQVSEDRISEEQAEEVVSKIKSTEDSQLKAFDLFKKLVDSGKASETEMDSVAKLLISTTLTPGQDRNAPRVMSFEDIEAVLKPGKLEQLEQAYQNSFSSKGKFDPSQKGGMGDLISSNYLVNKVSDEVATTAYYMLPSKVRSAIDKAGAVKGESVMFAGNDNDGNPTFSDKPTRERGVFLVKRWMEQGGLDPYTGKPIDIRNAEPEHMVAFAHALAKGGGGDQPRNLLWSASQPNNQKAGSGDNFMEWKERLQEFKKMGREAYEREVYNPAANKAEEARGKKGSDSTDIAKALSSQTSEERVSGVKGLIQSYGDKVRYLVRAAEVGWQHQDRDLDHRMGGKPAFMNNGVPKLPGTNVKPSTAVLVALAAIDPSKKEALKEGLEDLRKARILTDSEAQSVRGDNNARLKLQTQKSSEYGENLAELLNNFVPNLNVMLE
jgi:hypothetical protein